MDIFYIFFSAIVYVGIYLTWKEDKEYERINMLQGWIMMAFGMILSGVISIVDAHFLIASMCFVIAYIDYMMYKRKKEEFGLKSFDAKEAFLKDLKEYKSKFNRE